MIIKEQIEELSKQYKIDSFTILREYLQLVFLNYFYQQDKAQNCFFKGGTAIRLLFGSPRFSEDLDFSTILSRQEIKALLSKVISEIKKEIPSLEIKPLYSGKETERYRLKYLGPETKYPLTIRLDFNRVKRVPEAETSPIRTDFPIVIFPLIKHISAPAILAEKMQALKTRTKPRDVFDIWYLLELGIELPKNINKKQLREKIKTISQKRLERALSPFLPRDKRKLLVNLKERLIQYFQ